ncbi:thymidine kinase [Georgenia sp. Z1344]|uniref:thymidine kinase n=1 Tax=Georgenia sp. Z1344 TaxID=3416706 RepID=UPI003CE8D097
MRTNGYGRLQVVAGPMFSGKSEELLRRVRRARLAGLEVVLVNHAWDERYGTGEVSSHTGLSLGSTSATDVPGLLAAVGDRAPDLLAVDEAQFFGPDVVPALEAVLRRGTTVVVAGLSVTFDGRPFEPLPTLMAIAEDVTRLTAVCGVCGADAVFHQRIRAGSGGDPLDGTAAHVGGTETYAARCRRHHEP